MAKIIKRAGMIFFVSVISCLIALGCVLTMQVAESSNNGIVNADTQNNIYTSQNNEDYKTNFDSTTYEIPDAENEFVLDCDCPDGEPCMCGNMESIWINAITKSQETGKNVMVVLERDWIAKLVNNNMVFGLGEMWNEGRIAIEDGVNITLDLNGHTIDRKMTADFSAGVLDRGCVIIVYGILNLIDSKYDSVKINNDFNAIRASKSLLTEYLENLEIGRITGGYKETGNGGGAIYCNGTLNIYGGMFTGNYGTNAGAIYGDGNSQINIYDGIVANNNGYYVGGVYSNCILNIYGGIYFNNVQLHTESIVTTQGGVICYMNRNNDFNLYGGRFLYNIGQHGGAVYIGAAKNANIYNATIEYNQSTNSGGGLAINQVNQTNIYNIKMENNIALNSGGAIYSGISSITLNIYDCEINNNGASVEGGAIYTEHSINLYGGKIYSNNSKGYAGGIYNASYNVDVSIQKGFNIYGGVQIFNNVTASYGIVDLYLRKGQKIYVKNKLYNSNGIAHIGVKLAADYGDTEFTYSKLNNNPLMTQAEMYFYSNNSGYYVSTTTDKEAIMKAGTPTLTEITWSWGEAEDCSTTSNYAILNYSGNEFTITTSFGKFYNYADWGMSSCNIKKAGEYVFYVNGTNIKNPTFTLKIVPAYVEVEWQNEDLVYSGYSQSIQANLKGVLGNDDCSAVVSGSGKDVGKYMSTVSGLSGVDSGNYRLLNSVSQTFNIVKAKLEKPKGSGTFEYDGSEKEYIPNGYNNVTMNITGNKATAVGNYNATVSLKDKYNYVWNDGGVEDIVLPYSVTLTPPVDEDDSEYKFVYIDNDDGKQVRKTYKQGGLVHGINDGGVNGGKLVLGNVKPNTSVKSFIQILGFEQSKITIKDSKGKEIFKDGTPVDASNFDNGKELAVGTGWSVEYQNNGNTETIYISVLGDVNGDGRISASDCAYLRQIASDNALYESLSVEKKLASMVINKGNVTSADAEIVKNVINKMFGIDIFF